MRLFSAGAGGGGAARSGHHVGAGVLALSLAGCAAAAAGHGPGLAPASPADRGRSIAERECARCHSIGPYGASPRAAAPPFRDLRRRYNPLTFQRRMAEAGGHDEMPDPKLADFEVDAIAAYVNGL